MSRFKVDDEVTVDAPNAPFDGCDGIVREIDEDNSVMALVGVALLGLKHLRWYGEAELKPRVAEQATQEIPAVAE